MIINQLFKIVFLFCFIGLVFACSTSKSNTVKYLENKKYQKLAKEKYKNNIKYSFNQIKSYVLCKKKYKPSTKMPQGFLSFFVYDLTNDNIVYEKSIDNGDVKWANDYQLQISIVPGNISNKEDLKKFNYLYDIKEQKKILK